MKQEISLDFSKGRKNSYVRCFDLMTIKCFQLTALTLQREKPRLIMIQSLCPSYPQSERIKVGSFKIKLMERN